ncbi:WD repeat-containing protein wrap73, partial [Spiromyces aspiralis]
MLGKTNADVYIEEEVESTFSDLKHRLNMLKKQTVFKCESTPTSIRRNMGPDPGRPNPRVGVGFIEFNADGSLLCTRNDNMPNALWIWRVGSLELVAVVQTLGAVR